MALIGDWGSRAKPKPKSTTLPKNTYYNPDLMSWAPSKIPVRASAKTPPVKSPPKTPVKPSGSSGSSSGYGSYGGSGGSGGSGGIKKSNDAPQIAALEKMINTEFAKARDTKLSNIKLQLTEQDAALLRGYDERIGQLLGARKDNEMAEAASSYANLVNRARERVDLIAEAATMGAGETDTLRAQMQALRNWDANQADINRSFFDTQRSVNNAITDLNDDVRTARINAQAQALKDQEQVWANYYNQRADAYTQLGNIRGNPYSDSYKKGDDAFDKAATESGMSWKNPGVSKDIREWKGTAQPVETRLNNSYVKATVTNLAAKKPEGATLRTW